MITGLVWHERHMWHDTGTYANFLPAGGMSPIQPISTSRTRKRNGGSRIYWMCWA